MAEDWWLGTGGWRLRWPELGWLVAWGWVGGSDWSLAVQSVDWLVVQ